MGAEEVFVILEKHYDGDAIADSEGDISQTGDGGRHVVDVLVREGPGLEGEVEDAVDEGKVQAGEEDDGFGEEEAEGAREDDREELYRRVQVGYGICDDIVGAGGFAQGGGAVAEEDWLVGLGH